MIIKVGIQIHWYQNVPQNWNSARLQLLIKFKLIWLDKVTLLVLMCNAGHVGSLAGTSDFWLSLWYIFKLLIKLRLCSGQTIWTCSGPLNFPHWIFYCQCITHLKAILKWVIYIHWQLKNIFSGGNLSGREQVPVNREKSAV